ncbi:uncharacterized protein DFL_006746 [Arthrobotrys flagrans]|uniref:Clr5 domain-containing protein n=1 Tax=Arthrobotrys flagrans TaxID=97331 RepID=A0A436ZTM8_ARTFL|nr:hypothetical protein DFL_006746 [Arthrobotrys flagrans]
MHDRKATTFQLYNGAIDRLDSTIVYLKLKVNDTILPREISRMSTGLKFKEFTTEKRDYVPSIQWDDYKEFILRKAAEKSSQKAIIDALKREKGVDIKLPQLKRLMAKWGTSKRNLNRRQRNYIRTIYRRRRDEGKPGTTFQFKKDKRVIPDKQVNAALKGGESELLLHDENNDHQTPGLTYFTPMTISNDAIDLAAENLVSGTLPLAENHVHTDENGDKNLSRTQTWSGKNVDDATSSAVRERLGADGIDSVGEHSLSSDEKLPENIDMPRQVEITQPVNERMEEHSENIQAVCEEILNSAQSAHMAISKGDHPEMQKQSKDYSARFAADLEERILNEKRRASFFLQQMEEERVRSGGTLGVEECYSLVRERWCHDRGGLNAELNSLFRSDIKDPLPLSVYQQLHQLDPNKGKEDINQPEDTFWKEINIFYAEHLDVIANCYLRHSAARADILYLSFRYQAAHFFTLSSRFGPGHYLSVAALTAFIEIASMRMAMHPSIRILHKILQILRDLGMHEHSETIRILGCIHSLVLEQIRNKDYQNLKHLVQVSELLYHISQSKNDGCVYQQYTILVSLGYAYALNGEKKKTIGIVNFVKNQLMLSKSLSGFRDWRGVSHLWYCMGLTVGILNRLSEAKSCFESAHAANRKIDGITGEDRDASVEYFSKLGWISSLMGDFKLAIEKEKSHLDFRKEYYGVQDIWYLRSIERITRYMAKRGLVRYSQPVLRLTIETCEALGINEKRYYDLLCEYYGTSWVLDMAEFNDTYGQSWNRAIELD